MQPNFKDETGNRHGRLTVLERVKTKTGHARWKCLCDCGKINEVDGTLLRSGNTRSCGCLSMEMLVGQPPRYSIAKGEAAFNALYSYYRTRARLSNLEWKLDKTIFRELTKANCHYCGVEPYQTIRKKDFNGSYTYNGIDRQDNSKGYVIGNVVPCCGTCNRLKMNLNAEEFMGHILKILTHCYGSFLPHMVCGSGALSLMDSLEHRSTNKEVRTP